MWLNDLQMAMQELFEVYGLTCCVARIQANYITMTNGDTWVMDSNGHVHNVTNCEEWTEWE